MSTKFVKVSSWGITMPAEAAPDPEMSPDRFQDAVITKWKIARARLERILGPSGLPTPNWLHDALRHVLSNMAGYQKSEEQTARWKSFRVVCDYMFYPDALADLFEDPLVGELALTSYRNLVVDQRRVL